MSYSYVNSTTPDACRLLGSALTAGVCSTTYEDLFGGREHGVELLRAMFRRATDGGALAGSAFHLHEGFEQRRLRAHGPTLR
ncbi:MAG: hypothetical protein U0263_17515 [Polyangiaceae bacterium]